MTTHTPIGTTRHGRLLVWLFALGVPRHLPRWAVHLLLATGTLLVEWITLATGNATSPYPLLYFWVATCAFCFLSRVEATAQALLIVGAFAAGLVLHGSRAGADGALRWAVFALALAVGGAFIATLRAKHDRLMAELRTISRADPITGLLDRRGFDEAIANELERVRRSGSRFGLMVARIDGYEALPAGEREAVLAAVGAAIATEKRDIDAGARLEDDEFAILATYTDERGADVLADRVCATVREATGGRTTLSVGVVSHPRHGATTDVLLSAARVARAEALALGGDRSLVAVSAADAIAARVLGADVQVVPLT
jgi:diguanylate cyclase (GGDEF)-like protein